ncbi:MAG: hypothetical protein ACI8QZ_001397 [Chlamydiales bacterium]|jgi:hypothetical protein
MRGIRWFYQKSRTFEAAPECASCGIYRQPARSGEARVIEDVIMKTPKKYVSAALLALCLSSGSAIASGTHVYGTEMTFAALVAFDNQQLGNGRVVLDIEMRWDGSEVRYSGIWGEVPGASVTAVVGVPAAQWQIFVDDKTLLDGRWLDVEVGYFGGQKLWSGIFVEDGDDYAFELRTSLLETAFEEKLTDNLWAGRQVIDFEAYTENGNMTFAAIWTDDPNQPRTSLYYHLTFAQVSDLVNPVFPIDPGSGVAPIQGMAGRVIDFEHYFSVFHGETRYALIMSAHPGGGLWLSAAPLSDLAADDAGFTNGSTRLVDLDVYDSGGQLAYLGVWSNDVKTLNELPRVPVDPDPQPISPELQAQLDFFEAGISGLPPGTLGLYARNVRTNQSIGYNANRPFYLASTSKVPMHVRMWQLDESGALDLAGDMMSYSTNMLDGNPWYTDDRDVNGALGPFDFGLSFSLAQLDSFMVVQSDNSATSMLLDVQIGRSEMNEWLSSESGIGAGFHPLTAITDLDRIIMWQAQVNSFPTSLSYWFIPSWNWEPLFRTGGDAFGWMQNYVGAGNPLPSRNTTEGRRRYFRMGLNSAEPRAFGLFQERLAEGDFFNTAQRTVDCLAVMGTSTPLDDAVDGTVILPGFPAAPVGELPSTRTKNGGKGRSSSGTLVVNDTAIFQKGPDSVVMGVFTQEGSVVKEIIRSQVMTPIGYLLYSELISDLTDGGNHQVSDLSVYPGQSWSILADVDNVHAGDATPYKVRFYASVNQAITAGDILLGEYQTPVNHPGNSDATVGLFLNNFPVLPVGTYYLGWIIDAADEVGEWDDGDGSNTVLFLGQDGSPQTFDVWKPPVRPFGGIAKRP